MTTLNWAKFYSFEKVLRIACQIVKPKTIVEWGPGYSTALMLECSDAQIYSWEHSELYARYFNRYFSKEDRVQIYHGDVDEGIGKKTPYATGPFTIFDIGEVDLCFVDGRFRADCFLIAYHLMQPNGIVVMHDTKRPSTQLIKKIYPYFFENTGDGDGIGVYGKNKELVEKIQQLYKTMPDTKDWEKLQIKDFSQQRISSSSSYSSCSSSYSSFSSCSSSSNKKNI